MTSSGLNPVADPWAGVAAAFQSFQNGTPQPSAIDVMVDSLCRLNLGGIAVRLLSGFQVTGEFLALKEQWLARARTAPSGKVAWASRKRRFAANIATFSERAPDLAALPAFWESAQNRYELYLAADGNVLVFDTQSESPLNGTLGGLRSHLADAQQWVYQKAGPQFIMPMAFNGAGYGWLLARILESTARSFLNYSAPAYIVEPDPAAICVLLHVQDLRFAAERLRFFVGPGAEDRFAAALGEQKQWSLPGIFINSPMTLRPGLPLEKIRENAAAARLAKLEKLKQEVDAYYDSLPRDHFQQRFAGALAGKTKLTVVGITTRYSTVLQYSLAELGEAIRAAGHEFVISMESDDQSLERSDLELIAHHKPDLLVQISRMRYENKWLPKRLPFLCWDQDNLPCLRTPQATASLDDWTYVAGPAANIGFTRLHWPRRNCIFVMPAGQWHRYSQKKSDPELLRRYAADFSYISNASVRPEELHAEIRKPFEKDSVMLAALDSAAQEIMTRSMEGGLWGMAAIRTLIQRLLPGFDESTAQYHEFEFALSRLGDRAFRHATLRWVADYCRSTGRTLKLYGNGWDKTPGLSEFAGGVADPGEQVLAIYRATHINLQIIETGYLHSRLLDGIAAGGFFLSRISPLDYQGAPESEALFALVDWVKTHRVKSTEELLASSDPVVQHNLPLAIKRLKAEGSEDALLENLILRDDYRPIEIQVPSLADIKFKNREELVRLADRYLNQESHRLEMVRDVEQIMHDLFSYDTRWRQFLTGLYQGISSLS